MEADRVSCRENFPLPRGPCPRGESRESEVDAMTRLALGSLTAAVALFLWGYVYWNILAPSLDLYRPLPAGIDTEVLESIRGTTSNTGVYFHPAASSEAMEDAENWMRQHRDGPIVHLFVSPGREAMDPLVFVLGFLHMLLCATAAAWLLTCLRLRSFRARFWLVCFLGLFAGIWVELSKPIWFYHDWTYSIFSAGYAFSSWMIAAGLLASLVRPARGSDS